MAGENMDVVQLEFKSWDDAWYDVSLKIKDSQLIVHYIEFLEEEDEKFAVEDFKSVQDLRSKCRFSSKQLQDQNCGEVKEGMNICASYSSDNEDTRFFDAVVQGVCRSQHQLNVKGGEEECRCTFEVLWKDGPRANKKTSVSCENICLLTSGSIERHPIIKAFVKLVEGKVEQSLHRNTLKKTAADVKGFIDLEGSCIISGQARAENLSDSFKRNVGPRNKIEAVFSGMNEVVASTPHMPSISSQSRKMKEQTEDGLNAVDNVATDSEEERHLDSARKEREEEKLSLDLNSKVKLEQEQVDIPSHSEAFLVKQEETRLDSVRKKEKLSLDLNSIVELEQEQLEIPTTRAGFHSNANNNNGKDNGFLGISKNFGSPENQNPFHSGWLEEEDCGTPQIGKAGFNAINNGIAGNSACLTGDIRNKGSRLSDDHAVSACRGIKRPSLPMFMDNLDEGYNFENVGEQVTVRENTDDEKIREKKKVLASSWGKGKRQKHISNELFAGERKVQEHIRTGVNVNSSKKLIQDGNDFDGVDLLSSSCLTPHLKNSTSRVTTETLVFSTGMKGLVDQTLSNGETGKFAHDHKESVEQIISDEVPPQEIPFEAFEMSSEIKSHIPHLQRSVYLSASDVKVNIGNLPSDSFRDSNDHPDQTANKVDTVKCVTKHAKLNRQEKSSPGFLSVEENNHGTLRKKCDDEILDLSRQLDNHRRTFSDNSITVICEHSSYPSECRCCDLHSCNVNASSEDESFDGEVTNTRICRDPQEARCGCNGAGLGHCSEDTRTEDRQINYSEVLVLDNLEKDVRPSDVKKVIASVTCVVQVYIFPSPKFEQFTKGFVWFRDHASLMKALAFLQDDKKFIISSNGRPWVALLLHIDNEVWKGIFGGYDIESKDSQHCCLETPSSKILCVHKGTDEYERAKIRKNIYLEFKEHLAILHKRLELEECSGC